MRKRFSKVVLAGVGLLGGSLGLRLQELRAADEVTGYVRRAGSVDECLQVGVVNSATTSPEEAFSGAEMVVLCTPVSQMVPLAQKILPWLKPGVIVTDVGSTKSVVVAGLEAVLEPAGCYFVGAHPMAGSEKTGPVHAHADLFKNAICLLTPTERTNPEALERVREMWEQAGCRMLSVTPREHDELVCRASHLPHVLATSLVLHVLKEKMRWEPELPLQSQICASGFRDTTRIASGSPEMWRDIALSNQEALVRELEAYIETLGRAVATLKEGNPERVQEFFERGRMLRNQWLDCR